jgi:tetratricopeptide (TPR) repeat protein
MSKLLSLIVTVALGALAATAARADSAKATAYFEKGTRLYQVGEYERALVEFKAGHVEEPDPSFLFNIAQCHRQMGQPKEAITFYKRFLSLSPDTPMRGDVERKIKELEEESRKQAEVAPAPPPLATRPAPSPAAPLQPVPEVETRQSASGASSRWPLWLGAAVTLGLAAAATTMTLTTNSRYNDLRETCARTTEGCSNSQISDIRNRGRAINVLWGLTGVSALLTGIGIYASSDTATASVAMRF